MVKYQDEAPVLVGNPLTMQIDPGGIWRSTIFFGVLMCLFLLAWRYRKSLGWEVTCLWTWCLWQAIYLLEAPVFPFFDAQTAYQATAGQALDLMLMIPLCVLLISDNTRQWLAWSLRGVMIYEIAAVWLQWPGLQNNYPSAASFDTALLAIYLPFAPPWLAIASLATIVTHHGSTALLIIAAQLFGWGIKHLNRYQVMGFLLILAGVLGGIAHYHTQVRFFDGEERLHLFTHYMKFWTLTPVFWFIGVGASSFMWISFATDGYSGHMWPWLHNLYLQFLFEYGIIGSVFLVAVIVKALRESWHRPRAFCAALGYLACGLTYYPDRYFVTQLLGALILWECLYAGSRYYSAGEIWWNFQADSIFQAPLQVRKLSLWWANKKADFFRVRL